MAFSFTTRVRNSAAGIFPDPAAFHLQAGLKQDFNRNGFACFEDFWQLPEIYVDDINERRGGWSGVSRLPLDTRGGPRLFFLKRQENQVRRDWFRPFGALTYQFELKAIERNYGLGLPAVDVVGYGFQRSCDNLRGILITEEVPARSMKELQASAPDWHRLEPLLHHAGSMILDMHRHRISHGALYPDHLYLNQTDGRIFLIDFERSRRCLTVRSAIKRDLAQFLKRAGNLPLNAVESLLESHRRCYPALTEKAIDQYYAK